MTYFTDPTLSYISSRVRLFKHEVSDSSLHSQFVGSVVNSATNAGRFFGMGFDAQCLTFAIGALQNCRLRLRSLVTPKAHLG